MHYVITADDPDLDPARVAALSRQFNHCVPARFGVYTSRIGNYFDITLDEIRKNLSNHRHEVASVTGPGVTRTLLLHDRHCYLGQVIESEVVDWPATNLLDWR